MYRSENLSTVTIYSALFYILLGLGCDDAKNPKWRATCISTITLATEEQIGDPNHVKAAMASPTAAPGKQSQLPKYLPSHSSFPDPTGAPQRERNQKAALPHCGPSWATLPAWEWACLYWLVNNQQIINHVFLHLWLLIFSPLPSHNNCIFHIKAFWVKVHWRHL